MRERRRRAAAAEAKGRALLRAVKGKGHGLLPLSPLPLLLPLQQLRLR